MTKESLIKGNQIIDRLNLTEAFLSAIQFTDPSRRDLTPRISPIILQAGMAKPIHFDIQPENKGEVQQLDARMYHTIYNLLKEYKQQLETIFANLS